MGEALREMTFEEEYEILQREKAEVFANEDSRSEPPLTKCVLRRALRCIDKLLKKQQQSDKWIPCSKMLPPQPEENPLLDNKPLELYLVSVRYSKYPFRVFWNGKFFTDGFSKLDVTAWQPLPESYKESERL